MSLQIGIVGLPNAGKSTLFNALIGQQAAPADLPAEAPAKVGNFPFTTIDPNIGVVNVPDERLDELAELVHPEKITPATVQFVDIAGIVKGASLGEGLGNKFLANIREVDAIAIVVRAFEDPNVIHVSGKVDPTIDLEIILAELLLADLESVERQIIQIESKIKSGDKEAAAMRSVLDRLGQDIRAERIPNFSVFSPDDQKFVKRANLLTAKPFIVVPNIAETELGNRQEAIGNSNQKIQSPNTLITQLTSTTNRLLNLDTPIIPISAKIEAELVDLNPDEQKQYLVELGVNESGLTRLVQTAYTTLGLITYFTAGPKEVRAWTVRKDALAPEAAGVIHGDFEHGFIAAETVSFEDFVSSGGWNETRAKGLVRTEGKNYQVKDGDVMLFRFNV